MIKFASIEHLATEALSIGAKHGFTTHALNLLRDLLTAHAAPPAVDTTVLISNTATAVQAVTDAANTRVAATTLTFPNADVIANVVSDAAAVVETGVEIAKIVSKKKGA